MRRANDLQQSPCTTRVSASTVMGSRRLSAVRVVSVQLTLRIEAMALLSLVSGMPSLRCSVKIFSITESNEHGSSHRSLAAVKPTTHRSRRIHLQPPITAIKPFHHHSSGFKICYPPVTGYKQPNIPHSHMLDILPPNSASPPKSAPIGGDENVPKVQLRTLQVIAPRKSCNVYVRRRDVLLRLRRPRKHPRHTLHHNRACRRPVGWQARGESTHLALVSTIIR